ncbi:hypothetical protein ABVN64_30030 [Mycolicibacterium conceptionense]|uniref:hypothetical protein n=1 Tax=Mycolicibacterium conceptionense TaxID=451644 RepID=UPI00336AF11D
MIASQLNTLCAAYANVDKMSLHTASGLDTSNMLGDKESLSAWSAPANGVMTAAATFEEVTGAVRFVRVWDDTVFIEEFPVNAGEGVEVVAQDVTVAIQHRVTE